jgi:hypothetical protein
MARALKTFSVVLLAFALAGCTGRGRNAPQPREAATVRVENQSWLDMNIFAIAGGARTRLGTVTASTTRSFVIPASLVGLGRELSFLADPVGSSRTATSFAIFVGPGEEVVLTIPPTVR